ncbi:GntP family permease [Amycolatopsis thermoflava]|uniref:H+/gluconate symporter-like permease n=1 Tax=Amycolatopsis thermoflava TaxID=84480 RepID=A0A3N2H616_9PSEU|nr:SLC13 family permease [Amycolatopsis thermoflava]ROS44361.1 H+/gluconate symporter-like permease [Amycolatopsis thermoflava]
MSDTLVLVNTGFAVLATVLLIIRFRVNPVIALLLGASYLGLTSGLGVDGTLEAITKGFGDLMAEIGLLVAFGVLTGSLLQRSGAIERLIETLLHRVGPKRMPYALSLSVATVLQSIFLDVLVVIVAPLARGLGLRGGKAGTPRMITAMAIGMEVGVVMVVPGIAALALAGVLGVPLGTMLLFGLLVTIPTTLISVAVMQFVFRRGWWDEAKDEQPTPEPSTPDTPATGGAAVAARTTTGSQTRLVVLFAPVLAALLLIAIGAVLDIAEVRIAPLTFVCSPVIALLLGLIGTILVTRHAVGKSAMDEALRTGFRESGQILILNGVGGSLALTIKNIGLGDILGQYFSASTAVPLLLVWAVAAILHVAVGSVSISAITAAGILAPLAPVIGLEPVWIALAAGAGSLFAIHVTSNTFWLLQSLTGLTTRGTLKTFSGGVSVASVVAIAVIIPLSMVLG